MMPTRPFARRLLLLPVILVLAAFTLSGCNTFSGPTEEVVSYTVEVADPDDPSQVYEADITYYLRDTTQTVPGFGGGTQYEGPQYVSQTVVTRPDGTQFVLSVPPGLIFTAGDGSQSFRSGEPGYQTYDEIVLATTSFLVEAIQRDLNGTLETRQENTANAQHANQMFAVVDSITDISRFDLSLLF
ncbi:hypothetical protein [Gymnodinialimonas hymeniacidonis]|uniref:hypothetical protein n=1 Tax=Gymnodinialimonas hymeniacidonis TaxID=3126508 RepID=UPI0034C68619